MIVYEDIILVSLSGKVSVVEITPNLEQELLDGLYGIALKAESYFALYNDKEINFENSEKIPEAFEGTLSCLMDNAET